MPLYEISIGEPWDFEGPDGSNRIVVEDLGVVSGPNEPDWQPAHLLLRVQHPFVHRSESVQLVVASPRDEGMTLDSLKRGGRAAIVRVRLNVQMAHGVTFKKDEVEYLTGTIRPVT